MKTVFKYELKSLGDQSILIPANAEILTIQIQRRVPWIWALVDDRYILETKVIHTYMLPVRRLIVY